MTIVVAGFDIDPPSSYRRFVGLLDDEPTTQPAPTKAELAEEERQLYAEALKKPTKAFLFADSLLSRAADGRRQAVAGEAEKLFELEISLSIPDFSPHGYPSRRFTILRKTSCGVAYSGSPHMWQFTVERFREEMRNLHYTWAGSDYGVPGHYAICKANDPEDMAFAKGTFDESINFDSRGLPPLEGAFVADVFASCFDAALMDHFPKEYDNEGQPVSFEIPIEFLLQVYCEKDKAPKIYRFGWEDDRGQFPTGYKSVRAEVQCDEVAVLGQVSWWPPLVQVRQQAIAEGKSVQRAMEQKLVSLIVANAQANYVGGRLRAGTLSCRGFEKRKLQTGNCATSSGTQA